METNAICLKKALKQASEKTWPDNPGKQFTVRTIEDWWYDYSKKGFDALVPKPREDRGKSRLLSEDDRLLLKTIAEEHPEYTVKQIHARLVEQSLPDKVASYIVVLRHLNSTGRRRHSEVRPNCSIQMASIQKRCRAGTKRQPPSPGQELLALSKALRSADTKSLKRLRVGLSRFRILNYVSFLRETARVNLVEAIKQTLKRHHPGEDIRPYKIPTVEQWWFNFQAVGFPALIPKRRGDPAFRAVSDEDGRFIATLFKEHPEFTIKQIHGQLHNNSERKPAYGTVCRYLIAAGYVRPVRQKAKVLQTAAIEQVETRWILDLMQGHTPASQLISDLKDKLPKADIESLRDVVLTAALRWRNRALAILALYHGIHKSHITRILRTSEGYVDYALKKYQEGGTEGLTQWVRKAPKKYTQEEYKQAVFAILHGPPSDYGINRTTWRLKDIHRIMAEKGLPICRTAISGIIKDGGYAFHKAKTVLTSNDPEYRAKLQKITAILSCLKKDEKFFSIDEFGPFAVKMQGGRSLTKGSELKTVPQWQKSKGSLILTAALELSENQVTHFYSTKKNTEEMIKLLDMLLLKYPDESRIYFSWDAASWHASKKLYSRVDQINDPAFRIDHPAPLVELVPLPSCAQFLNVIESVFSGMAKAIIHNSNYQAVEAAMAAIDRYFVERNEYYRINQSRAGRKIWGKERVQPQFAESNNCKDPQYTNVR